MPGTLCVICVKKSPIIIPFVNITIIIPTVTNNIIIIPNVTVTNIIIIIIIIITAGFAWKDSMCE